MSEEPRNIEEREAKLNALRAMLNASIAEGEPATDDELGTWLDAQSAELAKEEPHR